MSLSSLVLFILFEQASITTELTWITKTTSYSICHGKDQLLMWDFTERADEKIMELQWFFNETTLICLESKAIGFHVESLYRGKIERKGKAMILVKNISLNDTGKYTLIVKLAEEKERNMQHIHLTVHEHGPYQCRPVVENASNPFLHCSTNCSTRSQLSPEWIINGTQGPKGIWSYLKFDAVTSEQALCCLKYHDHGDDQYNFCIPTPFLSNHVTENDRRGPNETNQVKENEIFAFAGCNATLEWTLGTSYLASYSHLINVFNANGTKIATLDSLKCETNTTHSSMYCEVRNISSTEWLLFVVLINVTESKSGVYVAQVLYGIRNETRVKKLKIIERPQIIESDKPIHDKSFSVSCKVDGKFDGLIYQWKLNGKFLNSTEHIEVNSSLLTFKRLNMVDRINSFSCNVCTGTSCCIESEPYIPDSYCSSTSESSSGGNEGHHVKLIWLKPGIGTTLLVILGIGILVLVKVWSKSG